MLSDVVCNMIDKEFIERASVLMKPEIDDFLEKRRNKINSWNKDNPLKLKKSQKKYYETDKGKYAISKRVFNRRSKFKEACEDLEWEEKQNIGRFYKNCPRGYEVDHIIPVSKGGKHCLSNLQYLTHQENRRKSAKFNWERE